MEVGSRRSKILDLGGEGGRSVAVAVVSTLVFFGLIVLLVVNSAGWPEVKRSFFNREIFDASFPTILEAFALNVRIFLIAEVVILVVALGIAVLRSLPGPVFFPLRALAVVYTDLFRGIPTILVVYILGFGAPALQIEGVPSRRSSGASSRSSSSTRHTWPRSTAPGSTRCTRARRRPPARWA